MPLALLLPILALFGLVIGSFLNVVIVRVPSGESIVNPPSKCPQCGTPLAKRDNIPVISWVLLRGRCRTCQEPIAIGYPLVELTNAVLWMAAGWRFGAHWTLLPYLALFSVLLVLSVIDLELYLLPNAITYPSIITSLIVVPILALAVAANPRSAVLGAFIGGLGYAGFLFAVLLAYELIVHKEGMGLGDVKLAVLLGIWVGYLNPYLVLYALIVASVVGLVVGMAIYIVRRESRPYPFGPWLAVGAVAVILASRWIATSFHLPHV